MNDRPINPTPWMNNARKDLAFCAKRVLSKFYGVSSTDETAITRLEVELKMNTPTKISIDQRQMQSIRQLVADAKRLETMPRANIIGEVRGMNINTYFIFEIIQKNSPVWRNWQQQQQQKLV